MGFESGSSLSVENSEEINHGDKLGNIDEAKFQGNIDEAKFQGNEPSEVENLENVELRSDGKEKEVEALSSASSGSVGKKYQVSPSSPSMKKGFGLKKWKRLPRDVSKRQNSHTETGNIVIEELPNSVANPTKRGPVYAERQRKTEDPFSPTSPVVGSLDGFSLLDAGLAASRDVDAGRSSQNGQDQNSNSSTAASVAKIDYKIPLVVGIAYDKSRMISSGKKSAHSLHGGQQGKGRIQNIKKPREERVKIEKENSQSSMESDSRTSNMQGIYTRRNGTRGEVSTHHEGENDDYLQDSLKQVGDAPRRDYVIDSQGGSQEILPEDEVTEFSWEVKNGRFEDHCSHVDQDPLAESISELRAAQEALAKELNMVKEISIDACTDDTASDNHPGLPDTENELHDRIHVHSPSGGAKQSLSHLAKETEDLFKKRMESEVIYLVISGKIQELRLKSVTSMQTQIHDNLVDPGIEVLMHKREAVELENLARVEEALKLQKSVRKYTSCFIVQLLLLVIIFGVVVFQSSPNMEIVPT